MKPGFDSVRAVKQWLDGIADLATDRCRAEWRTNSSTRLYFWYQPSRPGSWGRFAIAPHSPAPVGQWEIAHAGIFPSMAWDTIRAEIRQALTHLPVLDPSDLDAMPPAPALANVTDSGTAAPDPERPPFDATDGEVHRFYGGKTADLFE